MLPALVWFSFLAVVLLTICVCNAFFPRKMWGLFKSWRFKNPDVVEPSDLVVWWYRISGLLGVVLIIGIGAYGFSKYRGHSRCEDLLPELSRVHATGGLSALQRRAHDLGLEVEDLTYGSPVRSGTIVITEDGKPFATLYAATSDASCDV